MKIIGLTGSIATGKSTIAEIFKELGVVVYSDDIIVKNITFSKLFFPLIQKYFNEAIIDNKVNKLKLKEEIVKNPEKLKLLEDLLHPLVNKKRELLILKHNLFFPKSIILFESPLLFEKNINRDCNIVVATYCSNETQENRALKRENITKKNLDIYLKNQLSIKEKISKADYTINTENNIDLVKEQVKTIFNKINNE